MTIRNFYNADDQGPRLIDGAPLLDRRRAPVGVEMN